MSKREEEFFVSIDNRELEIILEIINYRMKSFMDSGIGVPPKLSLLQGRLIKEKKHKAGRKKIIK